MITIKNRDFDIQQIADSGQAFRINPVADEACSYELIAFNRYLKIAQSEDEITFFCSQKEFDEIWFNYFDLEYNYSKIKEAVEKDDSFLSEAVNFGGGIRILHQDLWETLISFIISQRKTIPAIKSCIESLCKAYGTPITANGKTFYSFPSPEQLGKATLEELSAHGLGYRNKYIKKLSDDILRGIISLEAIKQADKDAAFAMLKNIYGVGDKVANCVSLFGLHHIDAFPVDVWINRILTDVYKGSFDVSGYQGFGGIIQQYMFYYMRSIS